ncbi:MAG TPA: alanine--tRNA ligase [Candidatus Bathyarchaeia archaeon]|nr:alanine--tRNA ligase [Candidatus Bathyarchaeia archaeon]
MDNVEYDIEYFKENEFVRKKCEKCSSYFWTRDKERKTCGDAPCEIYSFIGTPIFKERSPDEIRELFLSFFEDRSHTRLKRYPVVARWRDDIYLTIASIADFQPFVTSGKVPPPANPLVISQPCIRLEDLESIGKSGRHLTAFEMMGHHAFNKRGVEEIYWKNETVKYCDEFLRQLDVDLESVTYKEAPWVGGGNAGPCLEVITGGLELATLVFMDLELSPRGDINIEGQQYRKMDTYIVDTGYGLERFVWASKGTPTVYDAMFPEVIKELVNAAGIEHPLEKHPELIIVHASLSGSLERGEIAKKLGVSLESLTNILEPIETIYAVADHTKCLAFMLADGIVPSNAKEGYLARLVLRRTFRMLKSLEIETPLEELVLMQIKTLRNSFPELETSVDRIVEIVSLEKRRYDETLLKGERIIQQLAKEYKDKAERKIPLERLINLYDTHGLPPEFVKDVVSNITDLKAGSEVNVDVPADFYTLVARMHSEERKDEVEPFVESMKEKTKAIPATIKLYYEEPLALDFEATVLDVVCGALLHDPASPVRAYDSVILDKTLFFPEGGGQPADTGFLTLVPKDESSAASVKVVDVQEVEGVILHKIEDGKISKGAAVSGHIDTNRRIAHKKHHTATHIVVCAARKVLGDHVWQAGAQKGEKRARIDIAHFKRISDAERKEIEMLANKTVMENLEIRTSFMDRNDAEQKYGSHIYQGGVPIGKKIRIVRIGEDEDVQACAGTHLSKTGECGPIKILRTERIQDGIARLEYAAGEAAIEAIQAQEELIRKTASILKVPPEQLPSEVERLFKEWKQLQNLSERLRKDRAEMKSPQLKARTQFQKEYADLPLPTIKATEPLKEGIGFIIEVVPEANEKELKNISSQLERDGYPHMLIGGSYVDSKVKLVSSVPGNVSEVINASEWAKPVSAILGGRSGGTATFAQGGGNRMDKINEAREAGVKFIEKRLKKKKK